MIQEKFVETRFGKIHSVENAGGAKTLIFFPGFTARQEVFVELANYFEPKGYHVIVPALPGHGKSFLPSADITYQNIIETMGDFVSQKANKAILLIGQSWGGGVAFGVAQEHPDNIKALVLDSPLLCSLGQPFILSALKFLIDGAPGFLADTLDRGKKDDGFNRGSYFNFPGPGMLSFIELRRLFTGVKLNPGLPEQIPVLVLIGNNDPVINWEKQKEVLSDHKKLTVEKFSGGHGWYYGVNRRIRLQMIYDFAENNQI